MSKQKTPLTLQSGQRLLVTVHYDGLLRCGGPVLAGRMGLIVETLHVELEMAITVKPEIRQEETKTLVIAPRLAFYVVRCYANTF